MMTIPRPDAKWGGFSRLADASVRAQVKQPTEGAASSRAVTEAAPEASSPSVPGAARGLAGLCMAVARHAFRTRKTQQQVEGAKSAQARLLLEPHERFNFGRFGFFMTKNQ